MNDIKLLNANEKCFQVEDDLEFIAFDTNMNKLYLSNHNLIYGIDSNDLKVVN